MIVHFGAIADERPFDVLPKAELPWRLQRLGGSAHQWRAPGCLCFVDPCGRDAQENRLHRHRRPAETRYLLWSGQVFLPRIWPAFTGTSAGSKRSACVSWSCADVTNPRAVGSWLSYDDLVQLVVRAIDTPITGFSVIYGVSNNDRAPVDNSKPSTLGIGQRTMPNNSPRRSLPKPARLTRKIPATRIMVGLSPLWNWAKAAWPS